MDDASVGDGSEKWGTGTNFQIILPLDYSRILENSSQSPIFRSRHPPTLTGLFYVSDSENEGSVLQDSQRLCFGQPNFRDYGEAINVTLTV